MNRKFKNSDPFMPWNDTCYRSDFTKPWNDPFYSNDPFAPWNSPLSDEKDYEDYCDKNSIPRQNR